MGLREDIIRRIEKKQQELADKEMAFALDRAGAQAYIQAMQDMLKSLPKESSDAPARRAEQVLRPGSAMAQAREAIRAAGRPLHINEIISAMGRAATSANRISVGGSISNYVRRGEIFVRTAPNTFGVIGMAAAEEAEAPPPDFGRVRPVPTLVEDDDELVV
ncbi:MAG: hypothetical protein ABI779_27700 [Acidobacteriota bacterium]